MSSSAFSADVYLSLSIQGQSIVLSHVGPEYVIDQEDCGELPAGPAELIVKIDDRIKRTAIDTRDPILGRGTRVSYTVLAETPKEVAS